MKNDIESRADIEVLVSAFYERVRTDELLAPIFSDIDWSKHLPVMHSFWASIILGEQSYRGNPFVRHVGLPLNASHFRRWLTLFNAVVDDGFSGEKAEEIKTRALSIAGVFQHRLNLASI